MWRQQIENMPKLRTYNILKTDFETEGFVTRMMKENERSILS